MRRLFKLDTGLTQIVQLMIGATTEEIIAKARNGEFDGADGIAVELPKLRPELRNRTEFARMLDAVRLPFMFIHYRNDFYQEVPSDEERQTALLEAAEAGAGMIDVMGDLYDQSPDERTRNPETIRRQMKLIETIHRIGAQVVMSSHPNRAMSSAEVIDQLKDFEQRGADVVKIVTVADTEREYLEAMCATMRANHELKTPFIHLCTGRFGRIQRFNGLSLGVAITFAVHDYQSGEPYTQPTIRSFKAVRENLHWHIKNNF